MIAIESGFKLPKQRGRRGATPPAVSAAFKAYGDAHRAVFGVWPQGLAYDHETKFIHIGAEPGVSLKRLKEMTKQLKFRSS